MGTRRDRPRAGVRHGVPLVLKRPTHRLSRQARSVVGHANGFRMRVRSAGLTWFTGGAAARGKRDQGKGSLVLLHQEIFRRMFLAIGAVQHGHRGNLLTRAAISRRRMVAIEFGMCRSGRRGGASGSVTVG
jgi:hypothetical protein